VLLPPPHCFICSKIYFDKEGLEKKGISLENLNILDYMVSHKPVGQDVSYYEYLGGKVDAGSILQLKGMNDETKEIEIEEGGERSITPVKSSTEPMAIVFSQIFTPTNKEVIFNTLGVTGVGLAGTGAFLGVLGTVKVVGSVAASGWAWIIGAVALGAQMANVNNNRYLTAGYCGKVSSGENARQGCSMVQIVPYKVDELRKSCGYFEGVS